MSVETFVFPTSFAQRRLWLVNQLEPASPSYNVPIGLGLQGTLDVPALERALATIVMRHEALRTTFSLVDGEPVQVVTRDAALQLPVVDLVAVPTAHREAEVQRLIDQEVRHPFDLERGPLLRTRLLRLGPNEHALLLVFHHIVFDGWSVGVLFRELSECYRGFATGDAPRLPELPVQYADYAVWQREWLTGELGERQLAYWRAHLAGAPVALELPTDFPRPRTQSYRGAAQRLLLSQRLLEGLKALSQQEGATLFMTLLAGFQLLLARYTGQDDIIVGSPIANRTRSELEHLIGFFVNSLALRTDLSGDPTFRHLLGRARKVSLEAYDHQDLPFEKLVEELQPGRVGDRDPLYQVMFALQNTSCSPLRLPGITCRSLPQRTGTAKFDLTLSTQEDADGLWASLEYRTDLFKPDTITRMLGHWEKLLEGVVVNPDQRLSKIPLLHGDERCQVPVTWNQTGQAYPADGCVHQPFVPPRTPVEKALAGLWRELLGIDRVGMDDNFFDLGGHSLLALKLFAEIERTFERRLPLSILFQAPTVGSLAEILERGPDQPDTGVVVLQAAGRHPPLFVVHGVDGRVLDYRELVSRLGPDQPVYGFEAPSGSNGQPVLSTFEELAARYLRQMRARQPAGPYFLCGYCWAGPLAFEIARQLRAAGQDVALLALIDSRCPGGDPGPLHRRIGRQGMRIWRLVTQNLRRLVALNPKAVPGFLWQRMVYLGIRITPVQAYRLSVRLGRPLLPTVRDVRGRLLGASWSYRPMSYPGRITLFRTTAPATPRVQDPHWGWNRVAAGGVESHEVSGEHSTLMHEPQVEALSIQLTACLEHARAGVAAK